MMHNASEEALPDISESLPQCLMQGLSKQAAAPATTPVATTANETKFGCSTNPAAVASNPQNAMWIQGPPPVFLNNEADLVSRSLDAFAFACRSCCDQANTSFEDMARAAGIEMPGSSNGGSSPTLTPTTMAVMAHENELCSRNIVLSAKTLLESATSVGKPKKHGLIMVAHAMSAFLENKPSGKEHHPVDGSSSCTSNEDGNDESSVEDGGGFSENQIKNLLVACDIIIQNPLLLHAPGNIYHMASNAAILLCHLLNGIYSSCNAAAKKTNGNGASSPTNEAETALFDEALDVFMSMRKLLDMHRSTLPVKLRCHGIPRPSGLGPWKKAENADGTQRPFIEMGDTLMCLGRGCQAFVLMGCSPCVAAERAMKAAQDRALDEDGELTDPLNNDLDNCFNQLDDFHLEDDQLLGILERIIEN